MILINKKTFINFFKYLVGIGLSLVILAIVVGALLFTWYASTAPELSEQQLKASSSSLVYDSDGNLIADLGSEKRENVTADNIPINLVNAVVAIEDHRFFQHRGIDIYRILGSAWHNFRHSTTQGGSTLDQQLIKLAYFSTNTSDQTLKRKAQEAWMSLQMERQYTKQEILTFYVNKVYMGNGNYGMLTAAKSYFGKDLIDLSVAQVALLAGIPQAPSQYDPYTQPEVAQERRNVVLAQMLKHEYITQEEYDIAIATPVTDGLQTLTTKISYPRYMDNYLKQVIEEVREKTGSDIMSSGLKIYTNVDTPTQQYLWDVYHSDEYVYYPNPDFQVASTIIDVTNGHVIAQLGGRNQPEDVSFGTNQAVLTDRDWGSTMKPISAYGPAIENGVYNSTAQSLNDSIYYWPGTNIQLYNWDRQYYGWMTMQTAIMQSRNVPAVRAIEATGLSKAQHFLNNLGIDYPEMVYANAISSNTSSNEQKYGASSEKMAAAYAAFANGGIYYKPQYVNKIEFADGTVVNYEPEGKRAMKETTAFMMTDMLKAVISYGTGIEAYVAGLNQGGKTGTSNYTDEQLAQVEAETGIYNSYVGTMAPDSTFVGFTPQYAMAVWGGYNNRLTPVYGRGLSVPAKVYQTMILYLTGGYNEDWVMPSGLYRSGGQLYLNGTYSTSYYVPQNDLSATAETDNQSSQTNSVETKKEEGENESTNDSKQNQDNSNQVSQNE